MHETRNRKVHHTQEETTLWTLVHSARAMANKAKASTVRAKAKGRKDRKDSTDRTRTRARTRTRIRLNVGTVESADTTRKTVGARRTPTKVVRRENTNPRMQRMLTILTRNQQMGVDTSAGKTVWPQRATCGKTIPGDSDLTFRTVTGELVKGGKRSHVESCDDWRSNLRVRGVQAPVCKPLFSVGEHTTMGGVTVLYGDKGYMFHKGSTVAKKIDAWIQKEMRDSQYRGCTVAYKENNVYNIFLKPTGK